jgi:hypothetical protein
MTKELDGLGMVKKLVAEKRMLQAPSVTCGSSEERMWWPPDSVSPRCQMVEGGYGEPVLDRG